MSGVTTSKDYIGTELEVFKHAINWRRYWQGQVAKFMGVEVLEVGAGIGTITRDLARGQVKRWTALETDGAMAEKLVQQTASGALPPVCEPRCGDVSVLGGAEKFDTVLYIDVLEHIEDDRGELLRVFEHLRPGGHLIILVPAHQSLYSSFDAAIGHFRRYGMSQLLSLAPNGSVLARNRHLDSIGVFASFANKYLLKQANPAEKQILTWDRLMIPISTVLDPVLGYCAGRSILVVWRKL